jgi:rhodanese-related sulfurtransferase
VLALQKAGVKNARALTGGFGAWVAGGNPVATGPQPR